MKWMKKGILYILVVVLLGILGFAFLNIFAFNKETEKMREDYPSVTDELVQLLYSYLDVPNDLNQVTFYNNSYMAYNNLSYSVVNRMAYMYIVNYDEFKLEIVDEQEFANLNVKGSPLCKVSIDSFTNVIQLLFGSSAAFKGNDFIVDNTITAKVSDDYIYFYTTDRTDENEYVYYKEYVRYTVTDNNNTIKIYEYFLKCSKLTKTCYNSENTSENTKANIEYGDGLNILDYTDSLKMYEHVFKYEDGNYYWYSTQVV